MRVLLTRVAVGAGCGRRLARLLARHGRPRRGRGLHDEVHTYSTVKAGKTGSKAGAVECLLHQAGYATSQNRSFSTADATKLAAFQSEHRLKATGQDERRHLGRADRAGVDARRWSTATRASSVRRLQLALRALGHTELPGTTLYGDLTRAAVKDLQARSGCRSPGKTSAAEWARAAGRRPGRPRPRRRRPQRRRLHDRDEGRDGAGLRQEAARRQVQVRRRRPGQVGLLGADDEGLGRGRASRCRTTPRRSTRSARRSRRPTCSPGTSSSSTPARRTSASTPATARSSTRPSPGKKVSYIKVVLHAVEGRPPPRLSGVGAAVAGRARVAGVGRVAA